MMEINANKLNLISKELKIKAVETVEYTIELFQTEMSNYLSLSVMHQKQFLLCSN